MKTILFIFSFVMMVGFVAAVTTIIDMRTETKSYKDSTAYWKGRYDSATALPDDKAHIEGSFNPETGRRFKRLIDSVLKTPYDSHDILNLNATGDRVVKEAIEKSGVLKKIYKKAPSNDITISGIQFEPHDSLILGNGFIMIIPKKDTCHHGFKIIGGTPGSTDSSVHFKPGLIMYGGNGDTGAALVARLSPLTGSNFTIVGSEYNDDSIGRRYFRYNYDTIQQVGLYKTSKDHGESGIEGEAFYNGYIIYMEYIKDGKIIDQKYFESTMKHLNLLHAFYK